ncbi:oxygenase MpaB family protein [Arthrobacter pigmenti]
MSRTRLPIWTKRSPSCSSTGRGLADIGAEGILLLGAGRAILLQIANPAVGHGVANHSDFASRPLDRLQNTMTYVYAVVYGNPEQLTAVRRRVNKAHVPVQRKAGDGPRSYSAFDPQLQLWVVATLYDTAVTVYERVYGTLDEESADRIYQDYAEVGSALQVPQSLWPGDRAAFEAYWNDQLQSLEADDVTRRVACDLLHPTTVPFWLRAGMPLARLITAGLLPAGVRDSFKLPWNAKRQRRFDVVMRCCSAVYPKLPRRVRHGLRDYYLGQLDRSM